MILIVAATILVSPCYSITTSHVASITVYRLPNPITIAAYDGASNITGAMRNPWKSSPFSLQRGSTLFVSMKNSGKGVVIGIYDNFSPQSALSFTLNGKPPSTGNAAVPESGSYVVLLWNFDSTAITVRVLSITARGP